LPRRPGPIGEEVSGDGRGPRGPYERAIYVIREDFRLALGDLIVRGDMAGKIVR
jgi:hypothetical protein